MHIKKFLPYLAVALLLIVPFVVSAEVERGALTKADIASLAQTIADWLYIIGFAVALVIIVVGGIMYMTAGGDEDKVGKAKKLIVSGLIGAAIVLLAGVILDTLESILGGAIS